MLNIYKTIFLVSLSLSLVAGHREFRLLAAGKSTPQDQSKMEELAQQIIKAPPASMEDLAKQKPELATLALARRLYVLSTSELFDREKYAESLAAYALAYKIALRNNSRTLSASLLIRIGKVHLRQENYAEAEKYLSQSLKEWEALAGKDAPRFIVEAANLLGIVHKTQGKYKLAIQQYEKSWEHIKVENNPASVGAYRNNIAELHYLQGEYAEAMREYLECLKLFDSLNPDTPKTKFNRSLTLHNIATVHQSQGNYARALTYYNESLRLKRESGNPREGEGTLNEIGQIHELHGRYDLAMEFYREALKIGQESGRKLYSISALNHIGRLYRMKGEMDAALKQHEDALRLARELGSNPHIAQTMRELGDDQMARADYQAALQSYQNGLEMMDSQGDQSGKAEFLLRLAGLSRAQRNYAEALRHAEQAGGIAARIDNPETLWRADHLAGQVHLAQTQPSKAMEYFKRSIATIEKMRADVAGGEQHQQGFFEDKLAPYQAVTALLAAEGKREEALRSAESVKARVLVDVMRSGRVNPSKEMTPAESEEERRLKGEIVSLNAQVLHARQIRQTGVADLQRGLEKARLDYEAFQARLYAAHPRLQARRGAAPELSAAEMAKLIDAQTAVLEYAVMDDKAFLFAITKNSGAAGVNVQVHSLPIAKQELARRAEAFRKTLAETGDFHQAARDWHDLLVKPARQALRGKRNLIIVPDGELWELPFQALLDERNRYLLQDFVIVYEPSLTALREMLAAPRKPAEPSWSLLAVGNPAFDRNEMAPLIARTNTRMDDPLAPLPNAERQVNAVKQFYDAARSRTYLREAATEARIKSEAGRHNVLHFATHGILNNRSPMYSSIVLAQSAPGEQEDGVLEAWELMNLELNADLAVLSACETARGRVGVGEGMIGLTWGLFVAGVPATVVSQWSVRDDSTADLMIAFHRALQTPDPVERRNPGKAEALRRAALEIMRKKTHQHPFHWAGFIVIGDGLRTAGK